MTTATDHLPAIRWKESHGQFCSQIGYVTNKHGRRVRDFQWLGKSRSQAMAKAITLQQAFGEIVERVPWGTAVWPGPTPLERLEAAGKVLEFRPTLDEAMAQPSADQLRHEPDPPQRIRELADRTFRTVTGRISLDELKTKWLEAQKQRIGLGGKRGLKVSTFQQYEMEIGISLAGRSRKPPKGSIPTPTTIPTPPISSVLDLQDIKKSDLQKYVDYYFRRAGSGEIEESTASKYCKVFKQMLDWAAEEEEFQFTLPKGTKDIFSFNRIVGRKEQYIPETKERLKKLIAGATNRTKLYILLALNCGFYQVDIAWLRHDEVMKYTLPTHQDEPCIDRRRRREKSTCHPTSPAIGQWWLFPETVALVKSELSTPSDDPDPLAFLNEDGNPLRKEELGKCKTCDISLAYGRLQDTTDVSFQFKQFRKLTSAAVIRIEKSDNIGRLFLGEAPQGSLKAYTDDHFAQLTEALKTWHSELRVDGIMSAV